MCVGEGLIAVTQDWRILEYCKSASSYLEFQYIQAPREGRRLFIWLAAHSPYGHMIFASGKSKEGLGVLKAGNGYEDRKDLLPWREKWSAFYVLCATGKAKALINHPNNQTRQGLALALLLQTRKRSTEVQKGWLRFNPVTSSAPKLLPPSQPLSLNILCLHHTTPHPTGVL